MKRIFWKIAALACLLVGVSACSTDFLEEKRDYATMGPTDIYSDPVQANAVFQKLYRLTHERLNSPAATADPLMRQVNNSGGKQFAFSDEWPSNTADGWNIVGDARYNGKNDKPTKSGNHIANPTYWNHGFKNENFNVVDQRLLFPMVYNVNNFIIEIDRSGRTLYDNPAFWDGLKGQAIFLRAWLQFDGARYYGAPSYYPTETDPTPADDRSPRMPIPEIIEKIVDDFEAAAALLPAKWENPDDVGRFTSVAAYAMISRVRLYAASPVFNASWDNPGSQRWELAREAAVKAITEAEAAGYGSSVNSIGAWDEAFYAYDSKFNPEAIVVVPRSNLTTEGWFNKWQEHIRPGVVANDTDGGGFPAPDQVMMKFPLANGLRATAENGYDDEEFYRNRDPRFYRTFAFLRSSWAGAANAAPFFLYAYQFSATEHRYTDGRTNGDEGARGRSRALVWKMSDPNAAQDGKNAGTDIIDYRFGELLLNAAECYAAQGNVGETVNYLTRVRSRVGAGTDDLGALSDRYELIKAVLNERAVELAFEGKRAVDMRRWLLFEGGAGFDPILAGVSAQLQYDPEAAWGLGWKLYNGKEGRPTYTKTDNVLTKLGLPRFSGSRHSSKIWAYDLGTIYNTAPATAPLAESVALNAVIPLTRDMNESQRNAAFDSWEAFLDTPEGQKLDLIVPDTEMGTDRRYGMDSGTSPDNQNFLFAWRGWYNVYSIHYDMYLPDKGGNSWITQTEGWMIFEGNIESSDPANQNGTYVYCTVEE